MAVFHTDTASIENLYHAKDSIYAISTGRDNGDVLVADGNGVYDLDLTENKKTWYMEWAVSNYAPSSRINDMNYISGNQINCLTDDSGEEKLKKVSVDTISKTVLTYRTTGINEDLRALITQFNNENDSYYIMC